MFYVVQLHFNLQKITCSKSKIYINGGRACFNQNFSTDFSCYSRLAAPGAV
jgi:hypothetical protein